MPTIWSSEVNKSILKQVEVVEQDSGYKLQFLKKLKLCTQNYSQKQHIILSFTSKFICNHLYLFIICVIYLESSMNIFFTTGTSHQTTGSLLKSLISGGTLSENVPWVPGIPSCIICPTYVMLDKNVHIAFHFRQ